MSTTVELSSPNNNNKRSNDGITGPTPKKARTVVAKFLPARYNYRTNPPNIKLKTDKDGTVSVQLANSAGWNYEVQAPPGICKFVALGEGGNIGKFTWCSDEKSATMGFIWTNKQFPAMEDESASDHADRVARFTKEQSEFIGFLKKTQKEALTALFNQVAPIRDAYTKKAKAVMPTDTATEKLNEMALKLMLKAGSKAPIKEDGMGGVEFQIKCGAFTESKTLPGVFTPRPITVYDGTTIDHQQHTCAGGDIESGAIMSPVFAIRLYTTPGYKTFGVTYQLDNRFIVLNKNGTGMGSVRGKKLTDEQLQIRAYQMKGHTNKDGKYSVYINDLTNGKYLHRIPPSKTKYCDLVDGTLNKFPGVTEATAKYTATLVEDDTNREYFNHVESLVNDVATFLFNDDNVLKDTKAELRATAQDVADETEGDVETTMKNLFMDAFQSPIKTTGEGRELKISQRMFQYGSTTDRVQLNYQDADCDPIDEDVPLERGCVISPAVEPTVYMLANGTAGVKLNIDLDNPIRVISFGGFAIDGPAPPAYTANDF